MFHYICIHLVIVTGVTSTHSRWISRVFQLFNQPLPEAMYTTLIQPCQGSSYSVECRSDLAILLYARTIKRTKLYLELFIWIFYDKDIPFIIPLLYPRTIYYKIIFLWFEVVTFFTEIFYQLARYSERHGLQEMFMIGRFFLFMFFSCFFFVFLRQKFTSKMGEIGAWHKKICCVFLGIDPKPVIGKKRTEAWEREESRGGVEREERRKRKEKAKRRTSTNESGFKIWR